MMMAAEDTSKVCEEHPMTGGDGPKSYAKNSFVQKVGVDAAKKLVTKAIAEKLDSEFLHSNTYRIADLGCSTGPNTFLAVENILEALEAKLRSQGLNSQIPEFHVFFNDHSSNDFNMLFKSLPPKRKYYAAGVPGSFYGRLFPNDSIHIAHSSYALSWLSRVPKAVADSSSPAWNKGRIHYSDSTDEVIRAYETQYTEDMECFLHARAQEIVDGGMMIFISKGRLNDCPHSDAFQNVVFQLLGSSIQDLVTKVKLFLSPRLVHADTVAARAQLTASHLRAAIEGDLKQKFGEEIIDELFNLFRKKCEQAHASRPDSGDVNFLVVLKRKAD